MKTPYVIKEVAGWSDSLMQIAWCPKYSSRKETLGACFRIDHLIDVRERKRIFEACFIEIYVINRHAPCFILLGDHNWVGQPDRVVDFSDEAGLGQLRNLLTHRTPLRLRKSAQGCFTGRNPGWIFRVC